MTKKNIIVWGTLILGSVLFSLFQDAPSAGANSVSVTSNEQTQDSSIFLPIVVKPSSSEPTPGNSCGDIAQEAEDGQLFGQIKASTNEGVGVIEGDGGVNGTLDMEDRVDFCLTISEEGTYYILATIKAPAFNSNSMYWTIDGTPNDGMVWHMNVSTSYSQQVVSDGGNPEGNNSRKEFFLAAGDYEISFYYREPNVAFDKFELIKISTPQIGDGDDNGNGNEVDDEIDLSEFDFPVINYSNVGLSGGIPNYTNEVRVTGTSENAIENAINNAPPFTRIILPAGTYNIGTIDISKSNIALVGEGNGCGDTILRFSQDSGIKIGNNGSLGSSVNLTADANRNTNVITVSNSDAGGYSIGDYVMVRQNDDSDLFRVDLSRNPNEDWVQNNATQINKIIDKDGGRLTLEGSLNLDYKTSLNARVTKLHNMITGVGIENLTLERTAGNSAAYASANIYFAYAANSWVEGVHSKNAIRSHIYFSRSYKNEIRGNFIDSSFNNGSGGNGYGIRLENGTSDSLVENNIARLMRHSYIAQIGANGNVFGYNYSADPFMEGHGEIPTDLSVHGGFGHSNLFEGNQAQHAKIDNVHASNSWNLFYRNRLEQDIDSYTYKNEMLSKGASTPHIWVHENQYDNTFLANEIGFPNANQATQTVGFDSGRVRDNVTVCKYTTSGDSERGCGRTRETTTNHGTHDYLTGQTTWDSSISQRFFPSSAYRTSKPSFWGSAAWPTFGPDTLSLSESEKMIPAKARFLAAKQGNVSYCAVD